MISISFHLGYPLHNRLKLSFNPFNKCMKKILILIRKKPCSLFGFQFKCLTQRNNNKFKTIISLIQLLIQINIYKIHSSFLNYPINQHKPY